MLIIVYGSVNDYTTLLKCSRFIKHTILPWRDWNIMHFPTNPKLTVLHGIAERALFVFFIRNIVLMMILKECAGSLLLL